MHDKVCLFFRCLLAPHIVTLTYQNVFFLLSVAALEEGSASTGLSSEPTVAEPTKVKRPVGRPKKRPRNLEDSKFEALLVFFLVLGCYHTTPLN